MSDVGGWLERHPSLRDPNSSFSRMVRFAYGLPMSGSPAIKTSEERAVTAEIIDLCASGGCFEEAAFLVIPTGRWAKLPPKKACKGCAKPMAAAFETKAGEPGGARVEKLAKPPKAKPAKRGPQPREK